MRYLTKFIVSSFLFLTAASADEEKTHDITVQIKINCPSSEAFAEFAKALPEAGQHTESFEEWQQSFIANMSRLIALVESGQVNDSGWSAETAPHVVQKQP